MGRSWGLGLQKKPKAQHGAIFKPAAHEHVSELERRPLECKSFTPPFPYRPKSDLPVYQLLRYARSNLLAIWPESAFRLQLFGIRLFRQHVIIVNSPDTVKAVFVDKAHNFERKSPQQRYALEPLLGDGLFISDGATWKERRGLMAKVTHVSRVPELAATMSEVVAQWRGRWLKLQSGTRIDALAHMGELTAEIICRSLFGRDLRPGVASAIVEAFSAYQAAVGQTDLISLLGLPEKLPRLHSRRVRQSASRIKTMLDELIDEVISSPVDVSGPSLIQSLASATSPATGQPLTRVAFRNEACVLFMAGHETTANTLAWAWFLLSQSPWAETALQNEADSVLGGATATHDDLARLPYARAVVQETLRLYPPVPLQARQAMSADRIRNRDIPAGALVIVVPWLLHRHHDLWERPDAFEPERWLPGGSGSKSRYAYIPFSIGPRICPGAAFGSAEAVICLATLAGSFRLRLAQGAKVEPVCRLTLRPGAELPMVLEQRSKGAPA